MVTCFVRYEIDPTKIADFERFAQRWIALANAAGGAHHGYFLPSGGASDVALALFTFPSFAARAVPRALRHRSRLPGRG